VPGAVETLNEVVAASVPVVFATNNASRPPSAVEHHLQQLEQRNRASLRTWRDRRRLRPPPARSRRLHCGSRRTLGDRQRPLSHHGQGIEPRQTAEPAWLRTIFRYDRDKVGVSARDPHRLRCIFGTASAEAGVDLAVIQALPDHTYLKAAFDADRPRIRADG